MGRVEGKKALVTGGAQGLGEATARMLAKEGAKVTVTDVNGPGAEAVAASINAAHGAGTAFAFQHDVTDGARWQEVLQAAHDAMGGLNILVNNAGIGSLGSVEDEDYDVFRKVQAVDVDSIFLGCKYAIPLMRPHGLGSIINISSIAGIIASGNYIAYNTAKAAVRHMSSTRSTARMSPTAVVGSPTALSTTTIITVPACGMPAAPTLAKSAVNARTPCCAKLRSKPYTCAMNNTATAS